MADERLSLLIFWATFRSSVNQALMRYLPQTDKVLAKTVYILFLLFLLPWIHCAIAFAKPYIRQQVFLEKSSTAVWVKRYEIVFA